MPGRRGVLVFFAHHSYSLAEDNRPSNSIDNPWLNIKVKSGPVTAGSCDSVVCPAAVTGSDNAALVSEGMHYIMTRFIRGVSVLFLFAPRVGLDVIHQRTLYSRHSRRDKI